MEHLHIKIDNTTFQIEKDGYDITYEPVYAQAERTTSLDMVKVKLGNIPTIKVMIMPQTETNTSLLIKGLLKSDVPVEFWDTYSMSYKTLTFQSKNATTAIARVTANTKLFKPYDLNLVATKKADWVVE